MNTEEDYEFCTNSELRVVGYDANDLEIFENQPGATRCIEEFCLD
jgi:hypothetical protein